MTLMSALQQFHKSTNFYQNINIELDDLLYHIDASKLICVFQYPVFVRFMVYSASLILTFLYLCYISGTKRSFRLTMRTSLSTMSSPTRRGPTLLLCNSERRRPSLVHLLTKTIVPFSIMYFCKCCCIHCPTVLSPGPLVPYTILCYFFLNAFKLSIIKLKKNYLNLISAISVPFLNLLQASSKFYFMFISLLLSLYHS